MARSLNQCNFIGRVGKDIELKQMPNGNGVANFSIACSDDYKDKNGQKVEQTNWINVVAFGKLAEIIGQYVRKGSNIFISGKQVTRKWQDQTGNDRYTTEIVANDMQMLDSKQDNQQPGSAARQQPQQNNQGFQAPQDPGTKPHLPASDEFDSDIPF
jgi:single-strand DNA-binding protein